MSASAASHSTAHMIQTRIATYRHNERTSYGLVTDAGIIDLGSRFSKRWPDLKSAIEAGQAC